MKRLFIILLIMLFINSYFVYSQRSIAVDKWMEYIEELGIETENTEQIETLFNDLSYLAEHPFNLNTVTAQQLTQLPFLSDIQIKELIEYIRKYGQLVSIYELKNVEKLDMQTIALLLPFVYISEPDAEKHSLNLRNMIKYGKNEFSFRYDQCLQLKTGYQHIVDSLLISSPNKRYLGEPFYNSLRYSYTYNEWVKAGLVAEKDAGESFFKATHKGYDFYSAHVFIQNTGIVKSMALGDYKVSFGQGLVVSNDFSPGRSAIVAQTERRTNGFRPHFSTNENDFFRGAATTVSIKKIDVSMFYSYRKLDGTVQNNEISSFKTDGLHRLVREKEKEKQISMQTFGANIRYAKPEFSVGITALSYSFGDKIVMPPPKPYTVFYFRGNKNMNVSIDYLFRYNRLKLFGETAVSKNGALATLNALQLMPASYLSLLLLHRAYSKEYQAYFGNAFAQGSSVQNEQGVYIGMEITPFPYWKLSTYADLFQFAWLKYGVDTPSSGKEYMVQIDYTCNKNFSTYFRYKYKDKESNNQHRFRLQMAYNCGMYFVARTSLDGILYNKENEKSRGWMISQSVGWKPVSFPLQTDVYIAYFDTDDYQTRISSYEKNILYAFSLPSFYGQGIRTALSFKTDLNNSLSLSVKLASVYYADRELIGSALEEIKGHTKTDIYALIRWKF